MGGDIIIFDVLSLDGEAKEGEREKEGGRGSLSIHAREEVFEVARGKTRGGG